MTNLAVRIRPETADDRQAIRAVVAAAFGAPAEADLVDRIRDSPEYSEGGSLVAVADGDVVVGHVMVSEATLVGANGSRRQVTMLSPLAVAPAHQGRGIGARLVEAAIAVADGRGEPFVLLEGSPEYYGRLGFEPASGHGITLPIPDWAPLEAAQVRRLANDDPTLAGEVVYPAAFDGLS